MPSMKARFIRMILPLALLQGYLFSQTHRPSWQQQVHYTMDVELDTEYNLIYGKEIFNYVNHSPDTLRVLYMHLYVNAFKKNSLMEWYQNERDFFYGGSLISYLRDDLLGYTHVSNIADADGNRLIHRVDDTILEILLARPIPPEANQTISLDFIEKIPVLIRRMGRQNREGVDYSMAQWYPKVCVYDRQGWHKNYYLGREFYGEFATFDVSITLPEPYMVGASGVLQNAASPGDMMNRNADSTAGDRLIPESNPAASDTGQTEEILAHSKWLRQAHAESSKRTWRFHADAIHDFAWCADTEYIYDSVAYNGVRINLLYLPEVAGQWQEMKSWAVQILKYLTQYVGPYPYRDFTIAQAGDGGMEYPNIVFITGRRGRFSLASVTAHEMAHNWFYGMLANDETREAWMDEGIASYYTTRLMESLFGRYANIEYETPFKRKWYPKEDARVNTFVGYESWARQGFEEKILTASDFFSSDRSYNYSVYYKGEIFMFALEYYFGKQKFDDVMRKYFSEWNRHHVTSEDMKRFFEQETHTQLDWLFEEWLNTTKQCDYAVYDFTGRWDHEKKSYGSEIRFERKGGVEMPLDVCVTLENDSSLTYRIPAHEDDPDIAGFTRCPVWNIVSAKYVLHLQLTEKIKTVAIDTSLLLADVHRMNNRTGLPKLAWHFQKPAAYAPTLDTYVIEHRPSLWYNSVDAARIGYKFNGKWDTDEHRIALGIYYGVKSAQLNYDFLYQTPLYGLGKQTTVTVNSERLDGRSENSVTFSHRRFSRTLYRPPINDFALGFRSSSLLNARYLPPGTAWQKGRVNVWSLSWSLQPSLFNSARASAALEGSTFGSEWNFSKFYFSYQLPVILKRNDLSLQFRLFGGYISGEAPVQEQFYLAGASPRQMFDDKFYRSAGTLPNQLWLDHGVRRLHYDGDGNATGYADANITGRRMFACNVNFFFKNPVTLLTTKNLLVFSHLEPYLLADGGLAWNVNSELHNLKKLILLDAGAGFRYALPVPAWWGRYVLKTDFPVWVSKPSLLAAKDRWAFRWVIGLDHNF